MFFRMISTARMAIKKVPVLMIRITSMVVMLSRIPAIIGENKNLADSASCTSPLPLENCSLSSKSVAEALYAGL
ncbi:hypothetical protein D3C76_1704300 [compost metagenome]